MTGVVFLTHRRSGRERGYPVVAACRRLDQGPDRPHRGALGARHPHGRGKLGLATRPVQEHHQPAGNKLGDLGAGSPV